MRRYFDHNATSPLADGVWEECQRVLLQGPLNPSSIHFDGRRARAELEMARRRVARSINARPADLRFTSGATEAVHDFMTGFLVEGDRVLVSPVEHPAVYGAIKQSGATIDTFSIGRNGHFDLKTLASCVRSDTRLVVVMMAQNETGALFPIKEIVELVAPIPVFVDGVQAYGKERIDIGELGVKGMCLSGHKIGGLAGCGVLWNDATLDLRPRTLGGSQEFGGRGGTENLIGAVSMGVAAELVADRIIRTGALGDLQQALERRLMDELDAEIVGCQGPRLPNTSLFRVPGVPGDLVVQMMDLDGFSVSTGSACSSGSVEPSKTLLAMGLSPAEASECVRVSSGPETSLDDMELLAQTLVSRLKDFGRDGRKT